jgi:citrate lyase subunit beta/citryl-CoA lyase
MNAPTPLPVSYLFVPATRIDRIAKARQAGADAVIVDLEDAVAASDKPAARAALAQFLQQAAQPVWVRCNAVGTAWHAEDLASLRAGVRGLAGIVLPKTESSADATALGVDVPVLALVESARGIAQLADIAGSTAVARLALGTVDLALDLGCVDSWETLLLARSQVVLHSRLANFPAPVDGVTVAIGDPEAAERDARRARELGFGAKLCIHPSQIAPVHKGFAPTPEQRAWAQKILALAGDGGAVKIDGQMIDKPVVDRARALLAQSRRS